MTEQNRQWRLAARPDGMVRETDFELVSAPMPVPGEGQALVRTKILALEPAMRGWIADKENYLPPVEIGAVMRGTGIGEVVASNVDGLAEGTLVSGMIGWQEYAVVDGSARPIPAGVDPALAISALGMTGITAYFGLLDVGQPKEGETVVVSGAAGATGSVAGQIAKIKGCRVIGIAGGTEKCAWLREEAGFDEVIDYKNEEVDTRLGELCPEGLDVFFDNVGGEILDAALAHLALRARVVICGSIATYNDKEKRPGPSNYYNVVQKRARIEGFVVLDKFARAADAVTEIGRWVDQGRIAWKADVQQGFENVPKTLLRLYSGSNFGKQLLEV